MSLKLCAASVLALACGAASAAELALGSMLRAAVPGASIKALRDAATVRQRFDFSCGSAALATLLTHHYGSKVSEQEAFEHMYLRGDQAAIRRAGFSLLDMQGFLAARGLRADGFRLPLQTLIDAQVPAIVLVSDNGYRHFVVVKGARAGRVLLGDPSRGTRSMTRTQFESIWVGGLLFVIHGHQGQARFNDAADWRAAPLAPLAQGIDRAALTHLTLPKQGPGDF